MKTEIVNPVLGNFISSLRDIGYTFEIAVADVLDNSIAAGAKNISIHAVSEPEITFALLDDGTGMAQDELIEAMRLAARNPNETRDKSDLGRFGLGLKTASFSQCRRLTVLSKKAGNISARVWDLDFISKRNEWLLMTLENSALSEMPLFKEFVGQDHGTLVVWELIDRYSKENFVSEIEKLRRHLAVVFHRFLEGITPSKRLKIFVNKNEVKAFNPFNPEHKATQQFPEEKVKINKSKILIQPFVLPHHTKLSQQDYERYATEDGYTKSQGFYLYRANRLLIYGTWWGLHRATDAHKLVRIKIDISNDQDWLWGIDIKKSTAKPRPEVRDDLIRIIRQITEKGARTYSGRGQRIKDKTTVRFWQVVTSQDGVNRFGLNKDHPLYRELSATQNEDSLLNSYLAGVQAFLPLEAIQAQLQQSPHQIDQEDAFTLDERAKLAAHLKASSLPKEFVDEFLKTEIFKSHQELLK